MVIELESLPGDAKIQHMNRDIPIMMTLIRKVSPVLNPLEMSSEYMEEPRNTYEMAIRIWIIFILILHIKTLANHPNIIY